MNMIIPRFVTSFLTPHKSVSFVSPYAPTRSKQYFMGLWIYTEISLCHLKLGFCDLHGSCRCSPGHLALGTCRCCRWVPEINPRFWTNLGHHRSTHCELHNDQPKMSKHLYFVEIELHLSQPSDKMFFFQVISINKLQYIYLLVVLDSLRRCYYHYSPFWSHRESHVITRCIAADFSTSNAEEIGTRVASPKMFHGICVDVSKNRGYPQIILSIINHPFWGTPIFWKYPYVFWGWGKFDAPYCSAWATGILQKYCWIRGIYGSKWSGPNPTYVM